MNKYLLKFQDIHALLLFLLLGGVYLIGSKDPAYLSGSLWKIPTLYWLLLAVWVPVLHQVYVLVCWRMELFGKKLSARWGKRAFSRYKKGFIILILARPLTLVVLAISNKNTLLLDQTMAYIIALFLIIPVLYLFYSIRRYFGFDRAFGIDHFEPEKYRHIPLVRKGIFRYSDNSMYTFGFLLLYLPALIWTSKAALLVAIFQHLYIWVHHYCTEKPDMMVIYSNLSNT